MKNRIVALIACELLLVAGGLWITGHQGVPLRPSSAVAFAAYVAAFSGLVLLPPAYVELKRHGCWLTPADFAILIGLFGLGPLGFVAAAMLAEGMAALRTRQTPLKTAFNLVNMLGGFTAAATTFALLGRTDPSDPVAWLCGVAAVAACATWDLLSTAAVLAIAEEHELSDMLAKLVPAAVVSLAISSLPGVAALVLFYETPLGPLLFAPVLGVLLVSTRGVSHQRAERMHFQHLYEASSNLARLVSLPDMLGMVATEARGLLTGAAAICCTARPDGSWTGMVADDLGTRPASDAALKALTGLTGDAQQGETVSAGMGRATRDVLPPFTSLVWAAKRVEPSGTVLLALFRELPPDEQGQHRSDILTAFVAHAATAVANVELHQDVQESLQRQVELNQQKSDFVAAVSHELRTPLTAMIGSVQTMRRLGERMPEDDRATLLDMGLTQGARLRALIDDLLLVAAADHRTVKCVVEPVALDALFTDLQAELGASIGERLRFAPPPPGSTVHTDHDKLRRVIANLVVNAGKYAPEGPIEVRAELGAGRASVTVTDSGPGIPAQDRQRIFERFVQLDQSATRRQGGTGLGLHLCQQLAEVLGGSIRVDEAPTGGARFTVQVRDAAVEGATGKPEAGRRMPAGMARSPLQSRRGVATRPTAASRPALEGNPGVPANAGVVANPGVVARPAVLARPAPAGDPVTTASSRDVQKAESRPLPPGMARSPLKRPAHHRPAGAQAPSAVPVAAPGAQPAAAAPQPGTSPIPATGTPS